MMTRTLVYLLPLVVPALLRAQMTSRDSTAKTRQVAEWINQSWELRFRHPDSARYFGQLALEAARRQDDSRYEAHALQQLGVVAQAQGNYPTALQYAQQALSIYQQLGEQVDIANACNNIGIVYDEMGDFTSALKYYSEAYTRYKKAGDIERQAMVSVNLGILFKAQGEYPKVIEYYHDAYAVYRQLNMPMESASCEANLGSIYYYTKQFDSSLHYSLLAEKAYLEQQNLQFLPLARCNAGMALMELGRLREAESYFRQSVEGHRSYNSPKELATVLAQLAKLKGSEKKYDEAIHLLEESKSVAESIGASQQVMDAAQLLSEYYGAKGDYRRALTELNHYSTVRDSLFEADKMRTIADFQTRYETDRKEQQIKLLKQEADIRELKLRQRNYMLISLLLLLVLGGVFTYFIMNRRKLKARALLEEERHRQQENATRSIMSAEERERRRIAADLHDSVGQTMAAALMQLDRVREKTGHVPELHQATAKALALVNDSYEGIRNLSHRMIPKALLRRGLGPAVEEMIDKLRGGKIDFFLEIDGLEDRLPEQTETILYRIIQEAVHNAMKHAHAKSLSVQLVKDENGLSLTIEDDGKGFNTAATENAEGMGMKNMRSRVALLGGTIDIESAEGRGTLIAVTIPAEVIHRD